MCFLFLADPRALPETISATDFCSNGAANPFSNYVANFNADSTANPGSDSAPNTRAFFEAIGYVFTYGRNFISDAGAHAAAYTRAHGTGKRFIINQFRLVKTCFIFFLVFPKIRSIIYVFHI